MKKIITAVVILLVVPVTHAKADCPSGICEVIINCTTKEVTYRDAAPITPVVNVPPVVAPPTSMVKVVTPTESFGAVGSAENVTQALETAVAQSSNPEFIQSAQQAVVQPYVPEPPLNVQPIKEPEPLSMFEAYALIDFNAENWIEQFFAWWEKFFPYQFTQEG